MSTDAGKIGAPINWLTELPENTQAIVRPALRTTMKATRGLAQKLRFWGVRIAVLNKNLSQRLTTHSSIAMTPPR